MKMYYAKGVFSLAVRIIMHELNLFCEYEAVDLKTKKTERGNNFFDINPKGSVPALVLENGEILTENAVIQQYLADKHKAYQLLPAVGNFNRYRVLEWLNYISTDLHKASCGPLFNVNLSEEIKNTVFKPILKRRLGLIEAHLEKNQFLLGEQFTIADCYLFVIIRCLARFDFHLSEMPNLQHYQQNLQKRKSIQMALQEEGLLENIEFQPS